MARHYIVRKDGVVQSYPFKNEKRFRREYEKAVPHRPRWAERKFKKRVRLYRRAEYYRSVFILNPHGTGIGANSRAKWSFNVQTTIFTTQELDEERETRMVNLAQDLADWIVDNLGLRNPTFDTAGPSIDKRVPKQDAKKAGLWILKITVKDELVAQGNYRSGRRLNAVDACLLAESCKSELYSVVNSEVVARVASKLRLCE